MAEAFLCEALTLLRLSKGDGQQQRRTNPLQVSAVNCAKGPLIKTNLCTASFKRREIGSVSGCHLGGIPPAESHLKEHRQR